MGKVRGLEFWRGHLAGWATSGLAQVAYCALHGLEVDAFRRQLYAARGQGRAQAESLRLVPVVLSGNAVSGLATRAPHGVSPAPTGEPTNGTAAEAVSLRVRGASDWRIECATLPSTTWLAALMKALS